MKNFKKIIALMLTGALAVSLASCGGKDGGDELEDATNITYNGDDIYPLECEDTLTYWMPLDGRLTGIVENFGETPLAKAFEKQTGIKVEYIHPIAGAGDDQFGTMLAGNELPDLVTYNWTAYTGGADAAIEDDVIYKLNDAFEKWAPNLMKFLKEHPEVDKKIKTDRGNYFAFPFIRGEDWMTCSQGLVLRKDWLEKVGLDEPKTLDDLEQVLIAFRDQCGAKAPMSLTTVQLSYFTHAYGTEQDFYVDGKTVKNGLIEDKYKEALARINKWYNEGLLDKNFVTADTKYVQSNVLNGETGAFYGYVVSGIGALLDAKPADQPDFDLLPCALTTVDGKKAEFSGKEDMVLPHSYVAISKNCKNLELACRMLDYGYSEAGHLLFNFGVEGESYEMKNGVPTFVDSFYNDTEMTFSQHAALYTRGGYSGIFVHDPGFVKQSFTYREQQQHAYDVWSDNNMNDHMMPPVTLTEEEQDEYVDIASDISTYADQERIKFVTGERSLDDWQAYVDQLETFGFSRAIEIKQAALDRYNKR